MKTRDNLYLAYRSFRAKKQNKSIVASLSISIFLLVTCLFLYLSINRSISHKFDRYSSVSSVNIQLTSEKSIFNNGNYILEDYHHDLINQKKVKNYLSYYKFGFMNNSFQSKIILDEQEFMLNKSILSYDEFGMQESRLSYINLNIIDLTKSKDVFIDSDYEVCSKPLLYGSSFSNHSKGEILVNSHLFTSLNIDPSRYIGKKISFLHLFDSRYTHDVTLDENEENKTGLGQLDNEYFTIFDQYKIVGIFNGDIYRSQIRIMEGENKTFYGNPLFWVSTESWDSNNSSGTPKITHIEQRPYVYYHENPKDLNQYCLDHSLVFLPFNLTMLYREYANYYKDGFLMLEFENFDACWKASPYIDNLYRKSTISDSRITVEDSYHPRLYVDYVGFYPIYYFVSMVALFIGIFVIIISLMNLFNLLYHDCKINEGLYGMLRANGLKTKEVFQLFIGKSLIILFISLIVSFVFGMAAAVGIKVVVDKVLASNNNELLAFDLSLNLGNYFLAFLIISLSIFIVIFLLNFIFANRINRKKIVEIVNEN